MFRVVNGPRKRLLTLAVLTLTACSLQTVRFGPEHPFPKLVPYRESTCPAGDSQRCAIFSPIQDLADQAFAALTTGAAAHYASLLNIGIEALEARVHLIRAARKTIEIQTYIGKDDPTGNLILRELMAAARRGVRVRIIGDYLSTGHNAENVARIAVTHENLQIKLYNPIHNKAVLTKADFLRGVFTRFQSLNHRMHNKIMVFDGRVGITGGRNFEGKYYDWDTVFNYIDLDVLVVGPAAAEMQSSFETYWTDPSAVPIDQLTDIHAQLFSEGKQKALSPYPMPELHEFDALIKRATNGTYIHTKFVQRAYPLQRAQFFADSPQKPFAKTAEANRNITNELRNLVKKAEHSILAQTPYFVLSRPAYRTLLTIRKHHPNIDFTVSTNSLASSDHFFVHALSFKRKKRNVQELGVKIYEFKPFPGDALQMMPRYSKLAAKSVSQERPFEIDPEEPTIIDRYELMPTTTKGPRLSIHSKSLVVDDQVAVIGSHNFDPRSELINTEAFLIVWDREFAAAVAENIRRATASQNSWVIARRQKIPLLGHISEFLATLSRMLPVFDIWPFRYTASFELRDGMEPVPPEHHDFYVHYKDVGQFPEVGLSGGRIQTLLVSAFGAPAEPLM
jgi:phosphatidylserine/phosphatidylglycerophosphate/cardiolipin synthase-like enzyme